MKKIITIWMCLFMCVCANQIFGFGIISVNGGFEIAGGGAGAATATRSQAASSIAAMIEDASAASTSTVPRQQPLQPIPPQDTG